MYFIHRTRHPQQLIVPIALLTAFLIDAVVMAQAPPQKPAAPAARAATADQPPPATPVDLFQPIAAFDLTPSQQRAIANLRSDPSSGPIQVYRVNLNVPKTADAVNFNLTPGSNLMLSTRSRSDRTPNDYSWNGGDSSGSKSAALVVKNQQVTGTIHDGDKVYRLRPLGDGATAVIEVNLKALPPEHPPAFDKKDGKDRVYPLQGAMRRSAGDKRANSLAANRGDRSGTSLASTESGAAAADAPTADSCGTIDVLVAYTPAAEQQAGSIGGLIQLAIDETNNSYSRSAILPRLRLVHQAPTQYVESGDMELDVQRLTNPSDGFLDDVPTLRNAHNADLAVLVTGNGNFCGIASDIMATADNAYAVVGQNCATGYYSFGHEVGHLQGARHNPEADPTALPFAFGHGFFSAVNRKRTVMSYDCPVGCTRIDVWAAPGVVIDGVPMGTAALHNDARVLNETACAMSGFRVASSGPVGPGPTPAGPVAGGPGTSTGTTTPGTPVTPTTPPRKVPSFSAWSLVALLLAAPLALARAGRRSARR